MAAENLTQEQFAERIGRTTRVIRKHGDAIRRNPDGTYPWPEAHEDWLRIKMTERERRYGAEGDDDTGLEEAQTRLTLAKAEREELSLAEQRGELGHIQDQAELLRTLLYQVDGALQNAPARHAAELAHVAGIKHAAAMRILEEIIERARADLRAVRGSSAA